MPRAKKQPSQFVTDYGRPIMIDICKDGTISYRPKENRPFNGVALPVFSVATTEQAKSIQVRFGVRQYNEHPQIPGATWYKWTNFSSNVEDLREITMKCRQWYNDYIVPKGIK